ncbi:MAG TPA: hypothetical protein VFK48_02980 [Usitatibacter sp.]|nr:hypothetical protein [Usitatibacter sp.]
MNKENDLKVHLLDPARPPVVLLGGINLVRTLGLAGLQAIVASSDPAEPALASRYCTAGWRLPPADQHDARLESLVSLGDRLACFYGRRIPLMYGSDDALELIYAHRERLERYYLLSLSDRDVAENLIAKDRFQAFAGERGLPVPRALAWEGDGPGSLRAATGPVVAKPRRKVDWHHSPLCHRLFNGDGKARVFGSGAEAAAHPVAAMYHEQLAFQEYIPGDDRELWSYHGLAGEDGEVLLDFVGRKVRTYPAGNGESAFIELAHDEGLLRAGRDVARRCPLRGVFKMDFKRDPRDGRWYLLEVNARYTLWHYLGAMNGVNLMKASYDHLVHGARPTAATYGTRYRWLSLALDFKAYREMASRGELSLPRWIASLALSRNIYNVFSWRDPGPWWNHWSSRVARVARRAPDRMASLLRQWRSTAS